MVLGNPRVKLMRNLVMSGKNLVNFAIEISKEDIPVMHTQYENMCKNECLDAVSESEAYFKQEIANIKLPHENDKELEEGLSKHEAEAV